jgi:hypothetical protein
VQRELAADSEVEAAPSQTLAKCSAIEATSILERIRSDYLACQVFFELGREEVLGQTRFSELHRVSIQNIMHHVRLGDIQHLAACLEKINEAFRAVRADPEALLFAFDGVGGCYIDRVTQQSILAVWESLVTARSAPGQFETGMPVGPLAGPACDIATHAEGQRSDSVSSNESL